MRCAARPAAAWTGSSWARCASTPLQATSSARAARWSRRAASGRCCALLQSPGRILSTEQLRDSLYGYSQDVESNAVNVHVHHLRRKLGHELVETVRGEGYRLGLHP